jgi:hypothetical protein
MRRLCPEIARRDPLFAGLFAVAAVVCLIPIWIGRYVPLLDYPNLMSFSFVLSHLHDPKFNFEPYYRTNLVPLPMWAQLSFVVALGVPFGVEIAQKLFLSLAVAGLPFALAIYARGVGRDPRLALLAFPLAWNVNTAHGFLAFCGALPVMFVALTALDRFAARPSIGRGALAILFGTSLYFFHILPFAMYLIIGGLTAPLAPRPWRAGRAIVAALPTIPAAALGLALYRWGNAADANLPLRPQQGLSAFQGVHGTVGENLGMFPTWLIDLLPCSLDEAAAIALGGAWLLLLCARPLDAECEDDARSPSAWRVEVAALAALTLYLLLPKSLMRPFYWFAVNRRLPVVVALFGLLLVRGRLGGVRRAMLAVAAVALLAYPIDLAAHHFRFNARARGFDEVMAEARPGAQVLPLMLRLGDEEVNVNCFNQWGTYVQMRQGGYMLYNLPVQFPIASTRQLPAPPWDHPEAFRFPAHGAAWDYFLIHGPSKVDPFAGYADRVRLVKRSGEWSLWEKVK